MPLAKFNPCSPCCISCCKPAYPLCVKFYLAEPVPGTENFRDGPKHYLGSTVMHYSKLNEFSPDRWVSEDTKLLLPPYMVQTFTSNQFGWNMAQTPNETFLNGTFALQCAIDTVTKQPRFFISNLTGDILKARFLKTNINGTFTLGNIVNYLEETTCNPFVASGYLLQRGTYIAGEQPPYPFIDNLSYFESFFGAIADGIVFTQFIYVTIEEMVDEEMECELSDEKYCFVPDGCSVLGEAPISFDVVLNADFYRYVTPGSEITIRRDTPRLLNYYDVCDYRAVCSGNDPAFYVSYTSKLYVDGTYVWYQINEPDSPFFDPFYVKFKIPISSWNPEGVNRLYFDSVVGPTNDPSSNPYNYGIYSIDTGGGVPDSTNTWVDITPSCKTAPSGISNGQAATSTFTALHWSRKVPPKILYATLESSTCPQLDGVVFALEYDVLGQDRFNLGYVGVTYILSGDIREYFKMTLTLSQIDWNTYTYGIGIAQNWGVGTLPNPPPLLDICSSNVRAGLYVGLTGYTVTTNEISLDPVVIDITMNNVSWSGVHWTSPTGVFTICPSSSDIIVHISE